MLGDEVDRLGVEDLGDDRQPRLARARARGSCRPFGAEPLEGVGRGARLERAAAVEVARRPRARAGRSRAPAPRTRPRTGPATTARRLAADRHAADRDDRVLALRLARDELVGRRDRDDLDDTRAGSRRRRGRRVPRLPVMPIAVRCAPGNGVRLETEPSTVSTTRRMSSAVAAASITMSIGVLSSEATAAESNSFRLRTGGGPRIVKKSLFLALARVPPRRLAAPRLRRQAQGRLADLRPDEVHGEGRPRHHHARERHGHGDQARPDRRRRLREVQQGELRQRRRDRHARRAASPRRSPGRRRSRRASRTTSSENKPRMELPPSASREGRGRRRPGRRSSRSTRTSSRPSPGSSTAPASRSTS